jgi:hypothetical protein
VDVNRRPIDHSPERMGAARLPASASGDRGCKARGPSVPVTAKIRLVERWRINLLRSCCRGCGADADCTAARAMPGTPAGRPNAIEVGRRARAVVGNGTSVPARHRRRARTVGVRRRDGGRGPHCRGCSASRQATRTSPEIVWPSLPLCRVRLPAPGRRRARPDARPRFLAWHLGFCRYAPRRADGHGPACRRGSRRPCPLGAQRCWHEAMRRLPGSPRLARMLGPAEPPAPSAALRAPPTAMKSGRLAPKR